jgi:anti-sigma regulatory factor (Ser/Thr protein kinase)
MAATPASVTRRVEHPARLENLGLFLGFIDQACAEEHIDSEASFALRLAVEEVCMNLIRHGYAGVEPGPIGLDFEVDANLARLTVSDRAKPFDPSQAPAPNLHDDAMHRPIGGLGWHLIKQLMDHVAYSSDAQRGNELILEKKFQRH